MLHLWALFLASSSARSFGSPGCSSSRSFRTIDNCLAALVGLLPGSSSTSLFGSSGCSSASLFYSFSSNQLVWLVSLQNLLVLTHSQNQIHSCIPRAILIDTIYSYVDGNQPLACLPHIRRKYYHHVSQESSSSGLRRKLWLYLWIKGRILSFSKWCLTFPRCFSEKPSRKNL